ncbi:hypothetical protein CPLU01_04589 [Colletotrichum plurivorum]|uniref:Uncharacterized protein n=1 Tax=Colletotrichum plurivorum TaxID=2175906 RepID=A0A8H6KNS0_9PEZI|nr:hypothetical protein CPLU01_04589 [Colletotrichum plurivorum]
MSAPPPPDERVPWTRYEFRLKSQVKPAQNQSSAAGHDFTESQPSQQAHADGGVPSAQQLPALPEPDSEDYAELLQAATILLNMRYDTHTWNEGGPIQNVPPAQRFRKSNFRTRAENGASATASSSSGFPPTSSVAFDHLELIQAEERSASKPRLSSYDSDATVSVHSETKSEQQGEEEEEEEEEGGGEEVDGEEGEGGEEEEEEEYMTPPSLHHIG